MGARIRDIFFGGGHIWARIKLRAVHILKFICKEAAGSKRNQRG